MTYAKHGCLLLILLLLSAPTWAKHKTLAGMLVTGSIVVAPDGSVAEYHLDKASRISPVAKTALAKIIPKWKFEPVLVDGKAVRAKSGMGIHLIATPQGGNRYAIRVDSVQFPDTNPVEATSILRAKTRIPPKYPQANAQGIVYLVLRINRQGKVDKVAVRQVNLSAYATDAVMKKWRRMFADASKEAARKWVFIPPTTGPSALRDHWFASLPVAFKFASRGMDSEKSGDIHYGKWFSFTPGPKHDISWLKDTDKNLIANIDALPNGSISSAKQSLHLLTPPSDGN